MQKLMTLVVRLVFAVAAVSIGLYLGYSLLAPWLRGHVLFKTGLLVIVW